MITNDDAACRTGFDPNRARGAKTLSQPATLQPATQHRAKRGQCHVTMDAQDIIGGVDFVGEAAGHEVSNV